MTADKAQGEGKKIKNCPQFPYFGASYPDAVCIDGSLHDLDDSPGGGQVYLKDDDFPCPFCRPKDFIKHHLDPLNGVTRENLKKHIEWLVKKYQPNTNSK